MVELVVEDGTGAAEDRENHPAQCATGDSNERSATRSTMLEPRLSASSGCYAATLHELPGFGYNQPNRSLPLRPAPPAPRRNSVTALIRAGAPVSLHPCKPLAATAGPQARAGQTALDDGPDDVAAKKRTSDERRHDERDSAKPSSETVAGDGDKEPERNGESTRGARDVKDAKMVHPLKLKRIALASVGQGQQPQQQQQQQQQPPPPPQSPVEQQAVVAQASEHHHVPEYSVMAPVVDCVEITIPSVPELGIKETRTSRIDLTGTPSKPIVFNYIVGNKDSRGLTPVSIQLPVLSSPISKASDGRIQSVDYSASPNQQSCDPKPQANEAESVKSMPLIALDDGDTIPDKCGLSVPCTWYEYRNRLRDKFLNVRAESIDTRQRLWSAAATLSENDPQRANIQTLVDNTDRQINTLSNILRQLNEANSQEKFDSFREDRENQNLLLSFGGLEQFRERVKLNGEISPCNAATEPRQDQSKRDEARDNESPIIVEYSKLSHPEDAQRNYTTVISESQSTKRTATKPPQEMPTKIVMPIDSLRMTQANGYSRETEAYNNANRDRSATEPICSASPRNYVIDTCLSPTSVIVDPCSRNVNSEPPLSNAASHNHHRQQHHHHHQHQHQQQHQYQHHQQQRFSSSFLIEKLCGAPAMTSAAARVGQQTRVPANSPREALVATEHNWAVNTHQGSATDLNGGSGEVQIVMPLNLANNKSPKRTLISEDPRDRDDKKKRRKGTSEQRKPLVVPGTTHNWTSVYGDQNDLKSQAPYLQPAQIYPPSFEMAMWLQAREMNHRHSASFPQEQLVRQADYRNLVHSSEYKRQVPPEYVISSHRIPEKTHEQTKVRQAGFQTIPVRRLMPRESSGSKTSEEQAKAPHESRAMAEQFPTLGNWVAGLVHNPKPSNAPVVVKKDSTSGSTPPVVEHRQFIPMRHMSESDLQSPRCNIATVTLAAAAAAANRDSQRNGTISSVVPGSRWTPDQHQHQHQHQQQQQQQQQHHQQQQQTMTRSFQPVPTAQSLPRHQIYPQTMTHALSYPAKFPMELYQKQGMTGNPYPYESALAYQRLASNSLEANGMLRVPALIPIPGSAVPPAMMGAEKRLAPQPRFYSEEASSRMPYSGYPRPACLINLEAYPEQQLGRTRDVHQSYERRPELVKAPFRTDVVYPMTVAQSPRNGSVISNSSSIYSSSNGVPVQTAPRRQQEEPQQQSHERLPTLGENRRSPSNAKSQRCANCGATGSRFECLGCQIVFYCNELCQSLHWTVHVTQCPKMMPKLKKVV